MQEIRYVTIPAPCHISIGEGTAKRSITMTLEEFVRQRTEDPLFGATLGDVFAALAIRQALAGSKPGDVIGLELDKWEKLCQATREPSGGYNPAVMVQCLPLASAILDAPSTDPRPKE